MTDPLTQIVGLLQPKASHSKLLEGAGGWHIHRSEQGRPFYCAVLEGGCRLTVEGHAPVTLAQGDFILIPAAFDFVSSSLVPAREGKGISVPDEVHPGLFRIGDLRSPTDTRLLVGYCTFTSPDATLLVSLLPQLVHVTDGTRLTALVELVNDESQASRPGREVVLARLVEVLLIEALRSTASASADAPPGLLRGLADDRISDALRLMHARPAAAWAVKELAREAGLSRSSFFERFRRAVGVSPMDYLLYWRMALAKDWLRRGEDSVSGIARRIGYSSVSTFSVAFARHVGCSPSHFIKGNTINS